MMDAPIRVLLEQFIQIVNEHRRLIEFNDQFKNIRSELEYMQCFLKDVKKINAGMEILNKVTTDLRELMYDAENIMADCELLRLKQEHRWIPKFTRYISRKQRRIGKRLLKLNQEIKQLSGRITTYLQPACNLAGNEKDEGNQLSDYPILRKEADIVGLKDDLNKLREWILGASEPPMVIGIVGLGGIGKTTLAKKIYDNVKESFMHTSQVVVSQSVKLDELLKKMLKDLRVEEKYLRGKKIKELLIMLMDKLDGKYLFVLDDVWGIDERQWWGSLRSALPQVNGSCIIVTTRNKQVAESMGAINRHIHHLQILSDDDSWSLFCKVAFAKNEGKRISSDLECIGREIVARCEGLPLAIKVVGGFMSQKDYSVDEWEHILEHLKEELSRNKNDELILSSLKLSYDDLPDYLKSCLLTFSLYPEDWIITSNFLTYHWIGEGVIWGRNGKTAIEIGRENLVELVNRCLVIVERKDACEKLILECRVHDMVRDMIMRIAVEENFASLVDKDRLSLNLRCRRVAIYKNAILKGIRNNTKLRTLLEWDIESKEIISKLNKNLGEFRWLRVLYLHLSSTKVDECLLSKSWLNGIGSLQHLIFLHIENSALETLPDSIGKLCNLKIFCLWNCPNLKTLPMTIASLEKLTVMHITQCDSLKCWPKGIGTLSNLERLYGLSLAGNDGFEISQLENLTKLRELFIIINYKVQFKDWELNALSMLKHLQFLRIEFGDSCQRVELSSKLDHLQVSPLKCLKEMYLINILGGERTPVWFNPTTFPNLRFLRITEGSIKCMGPEFLDSTRGAWKVEVLVLEYLEELEEEWSNIRKAISSLKLLNVKVCPKLKSFPFDVTARRLLTWRSEQSL